LANILRFTPKTQHSAQLHEAGEASKQAVVAVVAKLQECAGYKEERLV
jgi:hypothetical protein